MKLEECKQVQECYNIEDANKFLNQGYVLIKVLSTKVPINDFSDMAIRPAYILGLRKWAWSK